MTPTSHYNVSRFHARLRAHQATCPLLPLVDQVRGFLEGLTPSNARNARIALRHVLGKAIDWTEIRPTPYRRDRGRLMASIFDDRAFKSLLAGTRSNRELAFVWAHYTLRRIEVARMKWEHVSWAEGYVLVHGKGDKDDFTVMPGPGLAALKAYHAERGHPQAGYVFPAPLTGRPVTSPTVGYWFDKLLKRAGLKRPGRNCHAMRRTMATRYLRENPGDIGGLQHLMRHESIETTALYHFPQPQDLAPRLARSLKGF